MTLIIILIIIIVFIIIFYKNNRETFFSTNINLGDKVFNSKNNIFLGYNEEESSDLKKQLRKVDDFDLKKSNLILSNTSRNLTNISLDKNRINNNELQELISGSDEKKIQYFNTVTNENGEVTDQLILYNHEDKKKGIKAPNKLCLEGECIEKIHLGMANGSHTFKLNNFDNRGEHLIPIYTYSGGFGYVRFGDYHIDNTVTRRPFEMTFYQWNSLIPNNDYGLNGNSNYDILPHYINDDYDIHDIDFKYRDFKYFALYNEYSKSYLSTNGQALLRSDQLTNTCIFQFSGRWHGIHSRLSYHLFANYNMAASLPLGIHNLAYWRWMCQERWGWSHHRNCMHWATQNRPWFHGWEEMHLFRTVPISQGNNNEDVFIVSRGCWRGLSAWKGLPYCHFSGYWGNSHPGHNRWRIIPIADQCGEKCKADFGSKSSCQPPDCNAPLDNNVPKSLQCPIDRPKCRYYYGKHEGDWLGTCTKDGHMPPSGGSTINNKHLKPINEFRYAKPDQRLYKTVYNTDPLEPEVPPEDQNKDFFSEYSMRVAKNEKGKFYDPDVYKHFHDHEHDNDDGI